jgi:hypothetical protein
MRGEADRQKKTVAQKARPIALTLGGGAMLTLLTAGVAGAVPGAGTGEAVATGNQSGTTAGQHLTMTDGGVATLDAGVANAGGAGSNSGVNSALGNSGANDDDSSNIGGRINIDSVGNDSEGETTVSTGWAHSAGNVSGTNLQQSGNVTGGASLVILQQGAFVLNAGLGIANTGINDGGPTQTGNAWALGNWSENDIHQVADATSGTSLLVIDQLSLTSNIGVALANSGINAGDVTTGNAKSQGNESRNHHAQDTVADGDTLSAAVVDQQQRNRNRGLGVANTGFNFGDAGEGDDTDNLDQLAVPDLADIDLYI